jgi:hypothetical protein
MISQRQSSIQALNAEVKDSSSIEAMDNIATLEKKTFGYRGLPQASLGMIASTASNVNL